MEQPTTLEVQTILDSSPFIRFLQIRVEHLDPVAREISMTMPMRPELARLSGAAQFHGGPIASLIDVVGDFAVWLGVRGPVPTINFRVDYLRPCTGSALRGTGRALRVGRTIAVADVEVVDDRGRLCAIGRCCYGASPA